MKYGIEEAFQLFPGEVGAKQPGWACYAHPYWMLGFDPAFMCYLRPDWVSENYPWEMFVHNPKWMAAHNPGWMSENCPEYVSSEEEIEIDVANL